MKLSTLLAQYLYAQQRLDLPGLGRFELSQPEIAEPENAKPGKQAAAGLISFQANPAIKESADLVSYISAQTGKIKALATADLESFLELGQQFLNIGKPFLLEGIGTLEKKQSGEFSFIPGPAIATSHKESPARELVSASDADEPTPDYKSVFYQPKAKSGWKKPLALFLVLAGVGLAIWGGYTVYKRTTTRTASAEEPKQEEIVAQPDTAKQQEVPDTTKWVPNPPVARPIQSTAPAGNYKFVIETAAKERALSRFGRLKGFGLDVRMETRDSAVFKLFFILPANPADTAKMIDSLRGIYTPAGNRAYVEF